MCSPFRADRIAQELSLRDEKPQCVPDQVRVFLEKSKQRFFRHGFALKAEILISEPEIIVGLFRKRDFDTLKLPIKNVQSGFGNGGRVHAITAEFPWIDQSL